MRIDRRCHALLIAAVVCLAGCSKEQPSANAVEQAGIATASAATTSAVTGNPCSLISDAQVRAVFPDAKAGRLDRSEEQHGLLTCTWDHSGGQFEVLQSSYDPGPWEREREGLVAGFIALDASARKFVRFEPVSGVGDRAMAVIEPKDDARGIGEDLAQLVVQVGKHQAILWSPDLAQRDRAAALKALGDLGRAAARRL